MKMIRCDPCSHCQHVFDDSDPSVGYYGYGCDAEGCEWEDLSGTPCPYFKPILSSDSMMEQLEEEAMAEAYLSMMEGEE